MDVQEADPKYEVNALFFILHHMSIDMKNGFI